MSREPYPLAGWVSRITGLDAPDASAIRQWQMARVREVVTLARRDAPFYRQHLAGVQPDSLRTLSDLGRVPRTTADQLRVRPEGLLCASRDEVARVVTLPSSGTTGPPKRLFFTDTDLAATVEYFRRGMELLLEPGQTALILLPGSTPDSVGLLLAKAVQGMGGKPLVHGPLASDDPEHTPPRVLDLIRDTPVHCLAGPAAHLNLLAALWTEAGLGPEQSPVRSALLCWDAVPDAVVRNLGRALGCRCHRHWGMVETGLGGAVECALGAGPHLREAELLVEIADPDSGMPLPVGEWGEITVTTLTRTAMPLVRYRSGDLGRILPDDESGPCPCGSPLRRLDPIINRLRQEPGPTIKELNEALFAVDGLADFSAGRQGGELVIRICAAGRKAMVMDQALKALHGLDGVQASDLKVRLELLDHPGPAEPGLGKRRIRTIAEPKES